MPRSTIMPIIGTVVTILLASSFVGAQTTADRFDTMPLPGIFAEPVNEMQLERYPYPSFCVGIMNNAVVRGNWRQRVDTLAYTHVIPYPPKAIEAAVQCLQRFPVATTNVRWMGAIRQLALVAGDEMAYKVAVQRQLEGQSEDVRGAILTNIFRELLGRNAYPVLARYYIDNAVALAGAREAVNVIAEGNLAFGTRAIRLMDIAFADSSLKVARSAARQWFKAIENPSQEIIQTHTRREIANLTGRRYIRLARGERADADSGIDSGVHPRVTSLLKMWNDVTGIPLVGKPLPHVMPAVQLPLSYKGLLEPNVPTLLLLGSPECGGNCSPVYAMVRRVTKRFPRLVVKLVVPSYGSVRSFAPAPIEVQAEQIRAYFVDSLKVGRAVILDTGTVTQLSDPDRRRLYGRVPTTEMMRATPAWYTLTTGTPAMKDMMYVLTDAHGIVIAQELLLFDFEGVLNAILTRMFSTK